MANEKVLDEAIGGPDERRRCDRLQKDAFGGSVSGPRCGVLLWCIVLARSRWKSYLGRMTNKALDEPPRERERERESEREREREGDKARQWSCEQCTENAPERRVA